MKNILKHSLLPLLLIYTILVGLISLNLVNKYTLHFEFLAVILAIIAFATISKKDEINIKEYWIILPLIIILLLRVIPYLNNNIPLGYDTGIYKYVIDHPFAQDLWVLQGWELGLFLITSLLKFVGLSTNSIQIGVFIIFELILGLVIYITTKKYFNKEIGFLALLIYSVSLIQFKVFSYMYYKNVLGLILMLLAFYFLKDRKYWPMIITAAYLGGTHRPSYLIFAFIYIAFTLIKWRDWKRNIINGMLIVLLTIPFYIGRFREAILPSLDPILEANIGAGTFINFLQYQFFSLAYLPFALVAAFYLVRKKDFNVFTLWFLITGAIVYFQIIFFNRYIIHLDIAMIILAGFGLYMLITNEKKLGIVVASLLILSSFIVVYNEAANVKPLIDGEELAIIQSLNNVEEEAFVMSTSSYYSPWLQGYSGRRTIAPGLFDYDRWNMEEWQLFWNADNSDSIKELMNRHETPLYVFVGDRQQINREKFDDRCFEKIREKVYKWICQ